MSSLPYFLPKDPYHICFKYECMKKLKKFVNKNDKDMPFPIYMELEMMLGQMLDDCAVIAVNMNKT